MRKLFLGFLFFIIFLHFGAGRSAANGRLPYSGHPISLDLNRTDIHSALRIIAEVSNLNIATYKGVEGKLTLRLVDVPWDHALELILRQKDLYQVRQGKVIIIYPLE